MVSYLGYTIFYNYCFYICLKFVRTFCVSIPWSTAGRYSTTYSFIILHFTCSTNGQNSIRK